MCESGGQDKVQSSVKWRNLNPTWNECFQLKVSNPGQQDDGISVIPPSLSCLLVDNRSATSRSRIST